jgi:hypothetical protein
LDVAALAWGLVSHAHADTTLHNGDFLVSVMISISFSSNKNILIPKD